MKNKHKANFFNMIMMMVFFIIIIITAQNVGILKVYASWNEPRESMIKAISGEDESEQSETLVLEKFRVLLGLITRHKKTKPYNGVWENGSPAPAPVPVLGPAPAPPVHFHKRHRPPRPRPILPLPKFSVHHKENDKQKNIILAVLLSTGMVLVIFALGVFFISRRFNRQKKVGTRTTSLCSDEGGSTERSKSVKKVSHDTSIDMFYLNTLTTALEPEVCLRGACNSLNTPLAGNIGCASPARNNSGHEVVQSGTSLAEEIISVHEYAESSKNDSDDQSFCTGDKVVEGDTHLSEDESFHSFSDSRSSSNLRLSNASIGSISDPVDSFSPNQSNRSLSSPHNESSIPVDFNKTQQIDSITDAPHCLHDNTPPPPPSSSPPPPPPPPPPAHSSYSINPSSKVSQTSKTLHNSSLQNSEPPSGSKEAAGKSLCSSPSTPKVQGGPSTIPPPPCPPPYLNNKGNSIRGPPTPPGQPPTFTPMGKDGNPLPKLKPLHWDKVRATPDRSMVWDKLHCSSFELDEETIESLFGYSLKTAFTNDEGKSKSPSPNKHVLEPKRLQNITILSKALNVTAEKVCEALVKGDGLCTQQLEALVKMEPTKEEEAKLSSYKGQIDELGSAEKLVKELLKIPYAFERVEAMLYKATFDDEVVHLRNSFSMLEEACKELRSSRLFLKLLEAVLKTGNRMNVGTIRGGAKAFKLDALLKLADVKGTDGKTTLLHFVVQEIIRSEGIRMSDSIMGQIDRSSKSGTVEEKEDDYRRMGLDLVSGLSTELYNVKRTASLDLDVLATSVSNLSDGMLKLRQLVNKDLFSTNDNFVHVMKTFLGHAEYNLKGLQTAENMVLLSVRQITEYYHGDVSKEEVNPLRIFVVVRDFLAMLDQVCRELKTLKTPRSPNPLSPFR